jgi:hypothetical protein
MIHRFRAQPERKKAWLYGSISLILYGYRLILELGGRNSAAHA